LFFINIELLHSLLQVIFCTLTHHNWLITCQKRFKSIQIIISQLFESFFIFRSVQIIIFFGRLFRLILERFCLIRLQFTHEIVILGTSSWFLSWWWFLLLLLFVSKYCSLILGNVLMLEIMWWRPRITILSRISRSCLLNLSWFTELREVCLRWSIYGLALIPHWIIHFVFSLKNIT
jgi:hypothetical protein